MKANVIDQEMFDTLQGFFGETVLLFHRMTILADQIHGKGTGTLRQIVQSLLGKNPSVLRYKGADLGGGGWGSTEVELKPGPMS